VDLHRGDRALRRGDDDHLLADRRIAGDVQTRDPGALVLVGLHDAQGCELAAELLGEPALLALAGREEERGSAQHLPGGELDAIELSVAAAEPRDPLGPYRDPVRLEALPVAGRDGATIGQEDDVAGPREHRQRRLPSGRPVAVHADRLARVLVRVAVRAVVHAPAEELRDPGDLRDHVCHARRQKDATRLNGRAIRRPHRECAARTGDLRDTTGPELHGRVTGQVGASCGQQVRRRDAVPAEKAVEGLGLPVPLLAGVDQDDAPAAPPEHDRGGQAGRPATHDRDVDESHDAAVRIRHATRREGQLASASSRRHRPRFRRACSGRSNPKSRPWSPLA